MKTLLLLITAIIFSGKIYAQIMDTPSEKFSAKQFDEQMNHYFNKSKKQKTLAWILVGGGYAVTIIGGSLVNNNSESDTNNGFEIISSIGGLATLGSIPMFFVASKNKNKAKLIYFQKNITLAPSDSLKKIYTQDASEYFNGKAKSNTTAAIILSSLGGLAFIGGIAMLGDTHSDSFFSTAILGPVFILEGIFIGALSIPFYVRGAHLKRTSKRVMQTGRIPNPILSSISPTIQIGKSVAIGIRIQL